VAVSSSTPRYDQTELGVGGEGSAAAPRRSAPRELAAGAMVGRYVVIGLLGRGGMGAVYTARDPKLDRRVALKLLHGAHTAEAAARMIREAQALARLEDPHVVSIYDAGEADGRVFLAMQLVEGEDLASALRTRRPSVSTLLAWFVAAGRGLAAAHAAGLIHRDFKPSNVLIDRRDKVAVTDFGLARAVDGGRATTDPVEVDLAEAGLDQELTQVGALMGTPTYMSPEQHGGRAATAQSDQFSFCVALWEALFGTHPFLGPDTTRFASALAIGFAIVDNELAPPPRGHAVPRAVVEALTRGLAREPSARWPSMDELLAALAPPPPRRRTWPLWLGAMVVIGSLGGGVAWLATHRAATAAPPSCAAESAEQFASAWSPAHAARLEARFARSGRTYAATMATQAGLALERYGARWRDLAQDACTVERRPIAASAPFAQRRHACLEDRLDAARTLVMLLISEDRPEFVDRAVAMVDDLPDLGQCADDAALAAGPEVPPAALAPRARALGRELDAAIARTAAGDYVEARPLLASIADRADVLGWPVLRVRAHLALGEALVQLEEPARARLVDAAKLATRFHLDRDAARAWTLAVRAAGLERDVGGVAALAAIAEASAARVDDPALRVAALAARGRAERRLRQYAPALASCRAAIADAEATLPEGSEALSAARACLFDLLPSLARWTELEPLVARQIARDTERYGADHPLVADSLALRERLELRRGDLAAAHATLTRVRELWRRAYGLAHVRTIAGLNLEIELAAAEGKYDEVKRLGTEALGLAASITPEPSGLLIQLHSQLGINAEVLKDHAGTLAHFEQAIAIARGTSGADGIDLGVLLIMYGQYKAEDDADAGLALLGEAATILAKAGDARAALARGAMATGLVHRKRWAEARPILEEAYAALTADAEPQNRGTLAFELAEALAETHGDKARARALAVAARRDLATVGGSEQFMLDRIDAWLAHHR
jgi:tRNA A-37 threonylcarbamoyl transferase component Bud32